MTRRSRAPRHEPENLIVLRMEGGAFDGVAFLDTGEPATRMCPVHTECPPYDSASEERYAAADRTACAPYTLGPGPHEDGVFTFVPDTANPDPVNVECQLLAFDARNAAALLIHDAQWAASGKLSRSDIARREAREEEEREKRAKGETRLE